MKPDYHRHSCPACGQRVRWPRLYLRSWTSAQWPCECCGQLLQFHLASRLALALFVGVWIGFWGIFVLPHVAYWVGIVVCAIGAFSAFQLDRISVAEPQRSAPPADPSR